MAKPVRQLSLDEIIRPLIHPIGSDYAKHL